MSDIVVLCYHALSEDWPADLAVRPARFERQIELMLERGYEPSTFTKAMTSESPRKRLVVTFDDAFRSVLERALPVLQPLGVSATVFAVSGFLRSGRSLSWDGIEHWHDGPYGDQLRGMSSTELRELAKLGWEIGSHTRTHPHLRRLTDADLADELLSSRSQLAEDTGRECSSVAYPYGDVDRRVVAAARAAGYRTGAALPGRAHLKSELEWPRIGVYRKDDERRFKLKVSRAVRGANMLLRR